MLFRKAFPYAVTLWRSELRIDINTPRIRCTLCVPQRGNHDDAFVGSMLDEPVVSITNQVSRLSPLRNIHFVDRTLYSVLVTCNVRSRHAT